MTEMTRIRRVLGLAELPTPSMLYNAFNRLGMVVWRVILALSMTLLPTSGVVGVDASGFTVVTPRNTTRNEPNSRFSSSK